MLSAQVIQTCIGDLKEITKIGLVVIDSAGLLIASTSDEKDFSQDAIDKFTNSVAESQTIGDYHYMKVFHEDEVMYIVICKDRADHVLVARIAVKQLQSLLIAYREKIDKNNFFQNLLLDNLLLVDVYNRAKKLRLDTSARRAVILVEVEKENDNGTLEMLKNMFSQQSGDFVTSVDEQNLIVIKQLDEDSDYDDLMEISTTIKVMLNTEIMINGKIACGTIVSELKDVSKSYKEAKMALDVGKIFYADRDVVAYNTLGIGRLIYQLPINLCQMFIEEIFSHKAEVEGIESAVAVIIGVLPFGETRVYLSSLNSARRVPIPTIGMSLPARTEAIRRLLTSSTKDSQRRMIPLISGERMRSYISCSHIRLSFCWTVL